MNDVNIWIAIGTLIVMVIGLLLSMIKMWFNFRKNNESLKTLSEMLKIYRKQVELLEREIVEKISLEKEKLQLKKEKEQMREKWRQLTALGKIGKYILESENEL